MNTWVIMAMLGQSAQMEQCKLAVQVCTITKFNKQEGNIMINLKKTTKELGGINFVAFSNNVCKVISFREGIREIFMPFVMLIKHKKEEK